MVSIERVNYFNREFLPNQTIFHTGPSLIIRQQQEVKEENMTLAFFLQKTEGAAVKLFDKDIGLLEISLNFTLDLKRQRNFSIPLNVTREIHQMAQLLFTYFIHEKLKYSVDQVLLSLVNRTIEMNSKVLNSNQAFSELVDFMRKNIDRQLQVPDFCSLLHFSKSSLNRLCKDQAGMTVIKLFRKIQCREADRLLRETTLTIREISEILGFKNGKHFSTMYRKSEGISPLEKRQNIGGKYHDRS